MFEVQSVRKGRSFWHVMFKDGRSVEVGRSFPTVATEKEAVEQAVRLRRARAKAVSK